MDVGIEKPRSCLQKPSLETDRSLPPPENRASRGNLLEVSQTQTWVGSEGEEIRVWQGEKGKRRRMFQMEEAPRGDWREHGAFWETRVLGRLSVERGVAGRVEGLSGRAKEC